MKKIWITVLALLLLISLVACATEGVEEETSDIDAEQSADVSSDTTDTEAETSDTDEPTSKFATDANGEDKWDKLNPIE